jgi:hypothetical protein
VVEKAEGVKVSAKCLAPLSNCVASVWEQLYIRLLQLLPKIKLACILR